MNKILPEWLITFTLVRAVNPVITRQCDNLIVPRMQTLTGERGLKVRCPKLWNALPLDIKNSSSLNVFKRKIKKLYLTT